MTEKETDGKRLLCFSYFFIFQRDAHTVKRDIIRIFGINSSGTDYPPSRLLLKAPERWRKASTETRQDKRSRYPVVQQNTESYACGHDGDRPLAKEDGQRRDAKGKQYSKTNKQTQQIKKDQKCQ